MEVSPIGTFFGDAVYKYDLPRQGSLFAGHPGRIELLPGKNFETALRNLDGFERIWVIFQFHENEGWRPTTRPPVASPGINRVGIFASRSPYRPNPIGLSCLKLLRIEGLTLYVDESDLLNRTPVLDIKPYIPLADSFPNAKAGWVETQEISSWSVISEPLFLEKSSWIYNQLKWDLKTFATLQLSRNPEDATRCRLVLNGEYGVLSYRTFRIDFYLNRTTQKVYLQNIRSGYTSEELQSSDDKYGDKTVHLAFKNFWNENV